MQFSEFKAELNFIFLRDYASSIEELGFEEVSMKNAWAQQLTPAEYVDWLANRFDLMNLRDFKAQIIRNLSDDMLKQKA